MLSYRSYTQLDRLQRRRLDGSLGSELHALAADGGETLRSDLYFGICDSLNLRDWVAAIE